MREVEIEWRFRPMAAGWDDVEDDVAVWIDVRAFDQAWRETDQYVVPGGANGQDQRYARAGVWLTSKGFSDMLVVSADDHTVGFTDGRHRFSWLRDQGVEAMPIQASPESGRRLEARFATRQRRTVFKISAL